MTASYDIRPGAQTLEVRQGKIHVRGSAGLLGTIPLQDRADLRLPPPVSGGGVDPHLLAVVTQVSEDLLTQVAKSATKTQKRISAGFTSYLAMTWVLFLLGVAGFGAAMVRGFTAETSAEAATTAVFAGLSAASFVAIFLSQPVRAMGKAGPEAAWVLAIVNTYWTKLAYVNDPRTVVADLNEAQDKLSRAFVEYLRLTGQAPETSPGDSSSSDPSGARHDPATAPPTTLDDPHAGPAAP